MTPGGRGAPIVLAFWTCDVNSASEYRRKYSVNEYKKRVACLTVESGDSIKHGHSAFAGVRWDTHN